MPGLNPVAFAKCAPSLGTNIREVGSVTVCSAKPLTLDEYNSVFKKSDNYRVMGHLFHHDFEIRTCEAVQNGLYDFLMANAVNMQKKLPQVERKDGLNRIRPFLWARQYSQINNVAWKVSNGATNGAHWQITVTSGGNVPADARSFPVDMIIWIRGRSAGGSATKTAWQVVSTTDNGNNTLTLVLTSLNLGSNLSAAKLANPVTGVAFRGAPNKSDFESWCNEQPAYLNWKDVPFFYGTYRTSTEGSDQYDQWRETVLENPFYKEYVDLPEVEKNKQLGMDWQRRMVDLFFWSTPRPYQNANQFDQLDDIAAFNMADVGLSGLGADGGTCVGKRADPAGVYEQMAECGRIVDLQGAQLNIPAILNELYHMQRVRKDAGSKNWNKFDIFMDSVSAKKWQAAWVNYMNSVTSNSFRINQDFDGRKKANWGFQYNTYEPDYPQGVIINIVTHWYFDDQLSISKDAGGSTLEDTVRVAWILDFAGIYPGIVASNSATSVTGKRDDLAKISLDAACTIRTNTIRKKLTSLTLTVVVECPMGNLIIENFSSAVPNHLDDSSVYPATTTTTTSTTPSPYTG